ncbi:glycosyltransferase, partial [Phocaeicola plebeius]
IDGILMQKVNFPYEIIIGDDGSTDGTTEICKTFADNYPDKIRLFIRDRKLSQYQNEITGRVTRFNGVWVRMSARGKYLAICEGDDFWTDADKLQKQINFMETHPEYSMCFHNAIEHYESGEKKDKNFSNVYDKDYSGVEIYKKWIVPTASVVLKSCVIHNNLYIKSIFNNNFIYGDIVLFLSCAHEGKIRGFSDCMSVYRRHEGGMVFKKSYNQDLVRLNHDLAIYQTFGEKYKAAALNAFAFFSIDRCFMYSLQHNETKTRYDILWNALKKAPFYSIKRIIIYTIKKIIRYNSPGQ